MKLNLGKFRNVDKDNKSGCGWGMSLPRCQLLGSWEYSDGTVLSRQGHCTAIKTGLERWVGQPDQILGWKKKKGEEESQRKLSTNGVGCWAQPQRGGHEYSLK